MGYFRRIVWYRTGLWLNDCWKVSRYPEGNS